MQTSPKLVNFLFVCVAVVILFVCVAVVRRAPVASARRGLVTVTTAPFTGAQEGGSVLIYNLYSSSTTDPTEDTVLFIKSNGGKVAVHFFLVDGSTCTPTDFFVCLAAGQQTSFRASEIDPGAMGYAVAVAVDSLTGCPISFNGLVGAADIRLASGHQVMGLPAETFLALYSGTCSDCDATSFSATLRFDGLPATGCSYTLMPRALALANIPSTLDGNSTLLIVNSPTGDFSEGPNRIGPVFGTLTSDTGKSSSFNFFGGCQLKTLLSDSFPLVGPRFTKLIPAGHTGRLKFSSTGSRPLIGAAINNQPAPGFCGGNTGCNLDKVTFIASGTMTIPVFPPNC